MIIWIETQTELNSTQILNECVNLIIFIVYWSPISTVLTLIVHWDITNTILWIPLTIIFNIFSRFWTEWQQPRHSVHQKYFVLNMADSCIPQKTFFQVTATEAQEEERIYDTWYCCAFLMKADTNNKLTMERWPPYYRICMHCAPCNILLLLIRTDTNVADIPSKTIWCFVYVWFVAHFLFVITVGVVQQE